MANEQSPGESAPSGKARTQAAASLPVRITVALCLGVIAASVLSCLLIAAERSTGLTAVSVTATNNAVEPRDLRIPGMADSELPDYQVILMLADGETRDLGTIPNSLAKESLEWRLPEPLSLAEVSRVQLLEKDPALSDLLAEVSCSPPSLMDKGYRFDFVTERSFRVGLESFFDTPVGKAIIAGMILAIVAVPVLMYFSVK